MNELVFTERLYTHSVFYQGLHKLIIEFTKYYDITKYLISSFNYNELN